MWSTANTPALLRAILFQTNDKHTRLELDEKQSILVLTQNDTPLIQAHCERCFGPTMLIATLSHIASTLDSAPSHASEKSIPLLAELVYHYLFSLDKEMKCQIAVTIEGVGAEHSISFEEAQKRTAATAEKASPATTKTASMPGLPSSSSYSVMLTSTVGAASEKHEPVRPTAITLTAPEKPMTRAPAGKSGLAKLFGRRQLPPPSPLTKKRSEGYGDDYSPWTSSSLSYMPFGPS